MTPEFSHVVDSETVSESPRIVELAAGDAERQALARRFDLRSIKRMSARVRLSRRSGILHADGHVEATIVQSCVVTGDPLNARIDAPFSVRYVPDAFAQTEAEDFELSAEDCDTLQLDGNQIDLGELAAETLGLALDPFPRSEGAEAALRESGVLGEEETGPFAALRALKERLEKRE